MTTSGLTYNTAIAVEGLGLKHKDPRYKTETDTFCAMCGRPLPAGYAAALELLFDRAIDFPHDA